MSFRSLLAQPFIRAETNAFRISVEKRGVVFKLPQDAAKRLQWSVGTTVDLQIGEKTDAGKVLLCADPKGRPLAKAGSESNGLKIILRRDLFPGVPDRLSADKVRFELRGTAAIIAWLPWCEQPASAATTIPAEDAAPQGPTQTPPAADDAGSGGNAGVVIDPLLAGGEGHQQNAPGAFARESAEAMPAGSSMSEPVRAASAGLDVAAAPSPKAGSDPDVAGNAAGHSEQPSSFPFQDKSLAEIDAAAAPSPTPAFLRAGFSNEPGAYGFMSAAQTEEFVRACARDARDAELAEIAGKEPGGYAKGSVNYLRGKLAARIKNARFAQVAPAKAKVDPPPFKAGPLPPAPRHSASAIPSPSPQPARMVPRAVTNESVAEPKPTLSPALLKFLRDEVAPVLLPLNIRITKTDDDTGLLRNGKPVTLEDVVAEVNRVLAADDPDFEPISFDTAA